MNRYRTKEGVIYQGVPNVAFQNGLTYDKGIVMVFQLSESTVCSIGRHKCADRPLIDRTSISVSLEERWGYKRFQHEPSAKVDT